MHLQSAFDSFLRDYISLEKKLTRQIRMDSVYDEFKVYWRPGTATNRLKNYYRTSPKSHASMHCFWESGQLQKANFLR